MNAKAQRIPPLRKQNENMGKVYHIATARQKLYVKMLSAERYLLAGSVRFSQQAMFS